MRHRTGPLRGRAVHLHDVHHLVALLVTTRGLRLTGEDQQGCPVQVGVGHPGDEVRRPGAEGAQTHGRLAGQAAVHLGHERGSLLLPSQDGGERRPLEREHDIGVLFAGDREDVCDPL